MENINIDMGSRRTDADSSHSPDQPKVPKVDLERQEPASSQSQGPQPQVNLTEKAWYQRCCPCLSFDFFQPYFDVTTQQVQTRLMYSLLPFNKMFFNVYKEKPDLYGPFWIYTTLIVVVAILGNLARYIDMAVDGSSKPFEYEFNFVPVAGILIYSIGFGLPLALKLVMKLLGGGFFSTSYVEIFGIYGYSFSSLIVVTLLCCIPSDKLRWFLVLYAALASTGFLVVTYWHEMKQNVEPQKRLVIIGIVIVTQLVFFLVFRLYFFKHVIE